MSFHNLQFILVDSFVRDLFVVLIDDDFMRTDVVLQEKNNRDKKLEQEIISTSVSAASLAAQEVARDNRSQTCRCFGRKAAVVDPIPRISCEMDIGRSK